MNRLLSIICLLYTSLLCGQTYFDVEGEQIQTGQITKRYNFAYLFADSLMIELVDSTILYSNKENTVRKTVIYSRYMGNGEPSTHIYYLTGPGKDNIGKHFEGDKLSTVYQTKYDEHGREVYYSMTDMEPTYDSSFERFYEYRDSLTSDGNIEIQTVYLSHVEGIKTIDFRVFNFYDFKKRKTKEIRVNVPTDSYSETTIYTYDDSDSLISEKINGVEILSSKSKTMNTKCFQEKEYSFAETDYNSIRELAHQLLLANEKPLKNKSCENYFLELMDTDKKTYLTIRKHRPYDCEGRMVIFTTTEIFD